MEHGVWQPGKIFNLYEYLSWNGCKSHFIWNGIPVPYLLSVKIDWYAIENITHRIEILNSWNG